MRQSVKEYIQRVIRKHKVLEPICEIGSLQVQGQEGIADLRPLFKNKNYMGCDLRLGPGVDRIENVHDLSFPNGSIGTLLIMDTLEHVENVYLAMGEIYRVLKPGGMVIMSSVMNFPIHNHPADYWRFTPGAFELLLRKFSEYEVEYDGDKIFPEGVYGYGIKSTESKKSKYADTIVDLTNPSSSLTKIYSLVEPNKKILDFGCSSGYLAKVLKKHKECNITGLEINKHDTELAKKYCDRVINCDVGNYDWEKDLGDNRYDIAIFADILEHLKNPQKILKRARRFLDENGYILISVPNIAHLSIRLELLSGSFQYEQLGILDDTHLKYFTKASIIQMLEESGFFIDKIDFTVNGIPEEVIVGYLKELGIDYSPNLKKLFSAPESQAYQYIIKARKKKPENYTSKVNYSFAKPIEYSNEYVKSFKNQIKQTTRSLLDVSKELEAIRNSDGWKFLMRYYKFRDKIFPPNTKRRAYTKSLWKILNRRILSMNIKPQQDQAQPGRIKKGLDEFSILVRSLRWLFCPPSRSKLAKVWAKYKFGGIKLCWHRAVEKFGFARASWRLFFGANKRRLLKYAFQKGSFSQVNTYDVLFFSVINWDFRFQRPQQIATRFAQNGHRVFYISVDLRKQATYTGIQVQDNIYEITLPFEKNVPIYHAELEGRLDVPYRATRDLLEDFAIKESVAFIQFPMWYPLVTRLAKEYGTKLIFDCLDEFSESKEVAGNIAAVEEMLIKESDFCIVTSAKLYDKVKGKSDNVAIVRNGTDFEHFHNLPDNNKLENMRRPIIGYYGAIVEWFDTSAIEHIASERPGWTIVLIGDTSGCDIRELRKYKNMHFLGEKPYSQLPEFLYWFDVCVIPFQMNKLTLSANPVKFYEFISSGKPVVAPKLPELLPYEEFLYLYESKEEFLRNIGLALNERRESVVEKRIEFARANDWKSRFDDIAAYIVSVYPLVSIVIITYNNLEHTKLCIDSIFAKTAYPNYELIFVDNASSDGTRCYLMALKEKHKNIKVILNDQNIGFAAANNIGIKKSNGQYIILLNNDTVVTRGWISGLIKYLIKNPAVGMVGPVTNCVGNEAKINVNYKDLSKMEMFAERYTKKNKGASFEISMLAMYCVALSRQTIDKVGLLDERFLIGMFEDDDYALRIRKAGFKILCAEDVFIHHFGAATLRKLSSAEYQRIFDENKKKFETKWGIDWQAHRHKDTSVAQRPLTILKKHMPTRTKNFLKNYANKLFTNTSQVLTNEDTTNYIAYQNKLKSDFYRNRYPGFVGELLRDKRYRGIIFYASFVEWNTPLFQRPHQIFRELSRQGYVVFFLTPNPVVDNANPLRQINENLFLIRDIDMLYEIRDKPLIQWISWTPNIICKELFQKSKVVYDYIDELEVFAYYCTHMFNDHEKLLRESDVIIATADNLYSEIKVIRSDAVLIPNGVCIEDFKIDNQKVPEDLQPVLAGERPIIGYYGALAKWIDYDLVNYVSKQCRDLIFVFIGPKLDDSSQKLRSHENMFLLGSKRYNQLKYYLKHFDVAIIPFRIGKVANSASPIKLFEYMAMKKPIVVTKGLIECRKYKGVLIAEDKNDFIEKIEEALRLRNDPEYIKLLGEQARENTWEKRARLIDNYIKL